MICKKDVIVWFKELESYKRIDTMCTLLTMCLPFELRFLGTCLEELGRRDAIKLHDFELRMNNPQDFANDMIAFQKGEPTDKKMRRSMALCLALIRACNRNWITKTEIFRTLDIWGDLDFSCMNDMDTLNELLLVYIMAANHPVFSFEQHRRCIEIFERINSNKLVNDTPISVTPQPSTQQQQQQQQQLSGIPHAQMEMSTSPQPTIASAGHLQHDLRQTMPPPSHQEILQQQVLHAMHTSGHNPQLLNCPTQIQVIPQGTMPMNFPQHPMVDAIPHMSLPIIPADPNSLLIHQNVSWQPIPFVPPAGPSSMEHPPQSSSPMPSQQSSPSSSRTASPSRAPSTNVMQQGMQQQIRSVPQRLGGSSLKNVRRPSAETTPPPMAQMMGNEILPSNIKNVDEAVLNSDGSGTQLQSIIRNGYTRSGHHNRLKSCSYITSQQQPQQQQQSPVNQHFQTGNYATGGITHTMQNLALSDGGTMHIPMDGNTMVMNSNKSTGSDSGGSSGEMTPPETPTIKSNQATNPGGHRDQQQMKHHHHQQQVMYKPMSRLNGGRGEKVHAGTSGGSGGGGVSSGSTTVYAPATTLANTGHQQPPQPQPQFGDILLAPGGNAGVVTAANMMQATLMGSNNNSLGDVASSNTGGTVVTSNAGILQSHQPQQTSAQPQFATYPYHAAHHIATTRPPMMQQPPPNAFRISYPNVAMVAPGPSAPGGQLAQMALRPVSTANVATSTQLQQIQQQQQLGAAIIPVSPYSSINLSGTGTSSGSSITPKPISCYNCGSQTHIGHDCKEASIDDVTRSAIYKFDYSVSAASTSVANVAPTSTASGNSSVDNSTTELQKQEAIQHISTTPTASLASTVPATAATVSSSK